MKRLPQTLVHNFQFEFLARPQLICSSTMIYYHLPSPRHAWLLVFLFSLYLLCMVVCSCCWFVLFYGGQGIRQLKKLQ